MYNFGPNDEHIQEWRDFEHDGNTFQLDHLNAFEIEFEDNERKYKVYVTFSCHCFTKTDEDHNTDNLIYPYEKDPRHFNFARYHLSKYLPDTIKELPNLFTFHGGGKDNYCSCKVLDHSGKTVDYLIVFTMFKSNKKLRLHVTSAYPYQRGKTKKVKFLNILRALYEGKKLPGR